MPASRQDVSFAAERPPRTSTGCVVGLVALGCLGFAFFALMILSAVLFPVFAKAREKARAAACASNVKQIGLAAAQYCTDYDGYPPKASADPAKAFGSYAPPGPLVWQCPSSTGSTRSYQFNQALDQQRLNKIAEPALTVQFFEGTAQDALVYPHQGMGCFGFADGHVKCYAESSVPSLVWDLAPAKPQPKARPKAKPGQPGATPAAAR